MHENRTPSENGKTQHCDRMHICGRREQHQKNDKTFQKESRQGSLGDCIQSKIKHVKTVQPCDTVQHCFTLG